MMFVASGTRHYDRSEKIDYWLRRAEQETIAAIRATGAASDRHAAMAQAYSALATGMLGDQLAG
jgi:hypothetical protein